MENSTTCPACGTDVRTVDQFCLECGSPLTHAPKLSTPPRLQLNLSNQIWAGQRSVLVGRLCNQNDAPWDGELEIVGRGLTSSRSFRVSLKPESLAQFDFEFLPEIPGSYSMKISATPNEGTAYEAQIVIDVPEISGPTIVNVTDARHNEAKFIVGQESNIEVNVPQQAEVQSGLRAENFVDIDWQTSSQSLAIEVLSSVIKEPTGPYQNPQRFRADQISLCIHESACERNICLHAKQVVTLGKQSENDIVLRLLPESPENDAAWARISRSHAEIEFTDKGAIWRNLQCSNGTFIDEQLTEADEFLLMRSGMVFSPANVLELKVETFAEDRIAGDTVPYQRFATRHLDATLPETLGQHQGLRIVRTGNLENEEYVVMQRCVSIGSSRLCTIQLAGSDVRPVHAQLLWIGETFWIESLHEAEPILVKGTSLSVNQLFPLSPGTTLTIGSTEISVGQHHQLHVED